MYQERFGSFFRNTRKNNILARSLNFSITFTAVLLSWTFFRAKNLAEALYILKSLFTYPPHIFLKSCLGHAIYGFCGILTVIFFDFRLENMKTQDDPLRFKSTIIQCAVYYILIFAIILFGVTGGQEFIYFQF